MSGAKYASGRAPPDMENFTDFRSATPFSAGFPKNKISLILF